MNRDYFVKFIALTGVIISTFFAISHISEYFNSPDLVTNEYLLNFAVLELGWVALLIWFLYNIYDRSMIILLYTIPLLGINITHSIHSVLIGNWSILDATINVFYGAAFCSLFVIAYFKVNLKNKREKNAT